MTQDEAEIFNQKAAHLRDLILVLLCSLIVIATQTHTAYEFAMNPSKSIAMVRLAIFFTTVFDLLILVGCIDHTCNKIKRIRSL